MIIKPGQRNRQCDQQCTDGTHEGSESENRIPHCVCERLPVFFPYTDTDEHTGYILHACRNCPEKTQQSIGCGKGGKSCRTHILRNQHIDHQSPNSLIAGVCSPGKSDPDYTSRFTPLKSFPRKPEYGFSGKEELRLQDAENPQSQRRSQCQTQRLQAQYMYKQEIQQNVVQNRHITGYSRQSAPVLQQEKGRFRWQPAGSVREEGETGALMSFSNIPSVKFQALFAYTD